MLRLVEVNEIPERRKYSKIQEYLDEFARMDSKIVEVLGANEHYKNMRIAQGNWHTAIKRSGYRMRASSVRGKLYIIKLD